MKDIRARLERLENIVASNTVPLPALVRFIDTEADRDAAKAELAAAPKGTRLIGVVTICSRHCWPGCPNTNGPGCRNKIDSIPDGWQPQELTI